MYSNADKSFENEGQKVVNLNGKHFSMANFVAE